MRRLTWLLCLLLSGSVWGQACILIAGKCVLSGGKVVLTSGSTPTTWFGATLPTAPTTFTTTSSPPSAGSTCNGSYFTPSTAANLQTALTSAAANSCANGDVIELTAGTTYQITTAGSCNTGTACFWLPAHTGGTIYVISSHAPDIGGMGLPAAGTLICPSGEDFPLNGIRCPSSNSASTDFPTLQTNDTVEGCRLMQANQPTSHWRFVGIQFQCLDTNGASRGTNVNVIVLGDPGTTTLATLPSYITFDRCIIEGSPEYGAGKGIESVDGSYIEITESYFWNIFSPGNGDTNDIWGLVGPGPVKITDNFLYADGENTFFGGDAILVKNALVQDVDIENNHYFKSQVTANVTYTSSSTTLTVNSVSTDSWDWVMAPMEVLSGTAITAEMCAGGLNNTIVKQLTGTTGGAGTYQLTCDPGANGTGVAATFNANGKNTFEIKEGQRFRIWHNYFENGGAQGQSRSGLSIKVINQYVYSGTGSQTGTSLVISTNTNGAPLCNGQTVTFANAVTVVVSGISAGCTTSTGTYTGTPSQSVTSQALTAPSNDWVTTTDVDYENNILTNGLFGWGTFFLQDSAASDPSDGEGGDSLPAARWLIRNNLILLNYDDGSAGSAMTGMTSALPGDSSTSGGGGSDIIFDHNSVIAANGTNNGLFFGPVNTGSPQMTLSRIVYSNNIYGSMTYKFGGCCSSNQGYTVAITPQVTQPSFQNNVWVGATDATLPATNANPAAVSSVGFTSFGSATAASGYVLTSGSAYHAAGVSGLGKAYNSSGSADSSDVGANISLLPSN